VALEAIARQVHYLRSGREIPVVVARVDMAEIRRQQRQPGLGVLATPIAVKNGTDREAVPALDTNTEAVRAAERGRSRRRRY
jgi:hypothetical protein